MLAAVLRSVREYHHVVGVWMALHSISHTNDEREVAFSHDDRVLLNASGDELLVSLLIIMSPQSA